MPAQEESDVDGGGYLMPAQAGQGPDEKAQEAEAADLTCLTPWPPTISTPDRHASRPQKQDLGGTPDTPPPGTLGLCEPAAAAPSSCSLEPKNDQSVGVADDDDGMDDPTLNGEGGQRLPRKLFIQNLREKARIGAAGERTRHGSSQVQRLNGPQTKKARRDQPCSRSEAHANDGREMEEEGEAHAKDGREMEEEGTAARLGTGKGDGR